jgi:hypothetical protein
MYVAVAGRSATSLPKQQAIYLDGCVSLNGSSSCCCPKDSSVGLHCMKPRVVIFAVAKKDLIVTFHFTASVLLSVGIRSSAVS